MSFIRDLLAGVLSFCFFIVMWAFMLPKYFGWLIAEPVPLDFLGLKGQVLSTSLALGLIAGLFAVSFGTQIRSLVYKM